VALFMLTLFIILVTASKIHLLSLGDIISQFINDIPVACVHLCLDSVPSTKKPQQKKVPKNPNITRI